MLDEGIEISIAVEEGEAAFDAAGRDQRVDRLAHRDSQRPQGSKVHRRLDRDVLPAQVCDLERGEELSGRPESPLGREPLKDLGQDQIADRQRFYAQQLVELLDLRRGDAVEIVDPDT